MQTYLDFNQYIRQGEPAQKDRAEAWRVAIGLQAVDGLKTSEYLQQTARRNIEGDITIDEARELLKQYYISKTTHNSGDADNEEADKVSVNITKILSSGTFDFSANGIISLHRRIFDGVFKHAGRIRDYDISKKEWVLEGASVSYLNWEYRTSTGQVQDKFRTDNPNIEVLIRTIGDKELSVKEMMKCIGLKGRDNFLKVYLSPSIGDGFIRALYPDSPRHPRQKYLLTTKGMMLLRALAEKIM